MIYTCPDIKTVGLAGPSSKPLYQAAGQSRREQDDDREPFGSEGSDINELSDEDDIGETGNSPQKRQVQPRR